MTSSVKISMPSFARPPALRITRSSATLTASSHTVCYVWLDMPGKVWHVGEHELEFR